MKTITKQYNLYTFDELSQEAKDKARESFNKDDDYPFLQCDLREYIHEELKERELKELSVMTPLYDLSDCQGSGLMFEGKIEDKEGNIYSIKHRGNYYHEYSYNISGIDKEGEYIDTEDFEKIYQKICLTVRDRGYNIIEYNQSEECFRETCEASEYTFLENGKMMNY